MLAHARRAPARGPRRQELLLDEHDVVSGRFAEEHRFARVARDAPERVRLVFHAVTLGRRERGGGDRLDDDARRLAAVVGEPRVHAERALEEPRDAIAPAQRRPFFERMRHVGGPTPGSRPRCGRTR